jgi:glutaconate CoA-transferase subunit A
VGILRLHSEVDVSGKQVSMAEAISRFVPDGASVVMGAGLEALIPFAAGHELIRQGRSDLTLIGPISDILFDQLIGAGCVARVAAAWVGNVSAGLGHNYRRAMERGQPRGIEVHDHSNFSVALALLAGGLGAPYIPTRTLLGSDLLRTNPTLRVEPSPLDGGPTVLVSALTPDVAILHVQRSDTDGNCHCWGNLGVAEEAALASQGVIVIAEEVVAGEVIASDPNRVLIPGFKVVAVVHEPGGAHPSPCPGHYGRDHDFYHAYHAASREREGFSAWLAEWVQRPTDRAAYLQHLGSVRWGALQVKEHRFAEPVDYGY